MNKLSQDEKKISNQINDNEDAIKENKFKKLAQKYGISQDLSASEIEDILFEKNILSDDEFDKLDGVILKQNMMEVSELFEKRSLVTKQIKNLRKKRIELRKNKWVERPLTAKLIKQRQEVEDMAYNNLVDFFTQNQILEVALIELSVNGNKWNSSKINEFAMSPLKEAESTINGNIPFSRNSIEFSGYIPFTKDKFSTKYPDKTDEEYMEMEINWWVKFIESGKSIHDEFKKTGIDFIKVY